MIKNKIYKKPTKKQLKYLIQFLKERRRKKNTSILIKSIFLLTIIQALDAKEYLYGYYTTKTKIYIKHRYLSRLMVKTSKHHFKKWRTTKEYLKIYIKIKNFNFYNIKKILIYKHLSNLKKIWIKQKNKIYFNNSWKPIKFWKCYINNTKLNNLQKKQKFWIKNFLKIVKLKLFKHLNTLNNILKIPLESFNNLQFFFKKILLDTNFTNKNKKISDIFFLKKIYQNFKIFFFKKKININKIKIAVYYKYFLKISKWILLKLQKQIKNILQNLNNKVKLHNNFEIFFFKHNKKKYSKYLKLKLYKQYLKNVILEYKLKLKNYKLFLRIIKNENYLFLKKQKKLNNFIKLDSHNFIRKRFTNFHGSTFFIWTLEYGLITDTFFVRNRKFLKPKGILLFRINNLNNQRNF